MIYYISKNNKCIVLKKDNIVFFIPFDHGNKDYQEYLAWVAKGNTAEEYNPEEV